MSFDAVLDALACPVCTALLTLPTTLHCGHSICSAHLENSPQSVCPIASCSASQPASTRQQRKSSPSRVAYLSPPPTTTSSSRPEVKLDVTLNKVLSLVKRAQTSLHPPPSNTHSDSETDAEDDADNTTGRASLSSSASPSPPLRPHKRRRRRLSRSPTADAEAAYDADGDLLAHLSSQARLQKITPAHVPLPDHAPDRTSQDDSGVPDDIMNRFEKDLLVELMCEICFAVLHEPITTPCQHTFCSKCLYRSLDHSSCCPLCRQDLPVYSYFQDHPTNAVVLKLLTATLPSLSHAYTIRADAIEAEERHARLDTPIFICQLSFPGMPTLLHFFEPRYRLMLRRCLESPTPRFGMVMPSKPSLSTSSADSTSSYPLQVEYGTMLEIRSVQMLSDGRSMVETWGTSRFRILERGVLDGYMVGRIEIIEDYPEEMDEADSFSSSTTSASDTASDSEKSEDRLPQTTRNTPSPRPRSNSMSDSLINLLSSQLPSSEEVASSSSSSNTTLREPEPEAERLGRRRHKSHARSVSQSQTRTKTVPLSTQELISHCLAFLNKLHTGAAPWISQRFNHAYGFAGLELESILHPETSEASSLSSNPVHSPSTLSFYIATLLPIDDYEKAKLLPIKSARMRLQICVWWIESLQRHWWFDKGCVVL